QEGEREMHVQPGNPEGQWAYAPWSVERGARDPERQNHSEQAPVPETSHQFMALDVGETRRRESTRRTAARLAEGSADQDQSRHHGDERQQEERKFPSQLLRERVVAVKAF